jgi:hypothetical protein
MDNKDILHNQGYDFFATGPKGNEIRSGNTSVWIPGGKAKHNAIYVGSGLKVCNASRLAKLLSLSEFENVIMSAEHFSWIFDSDEIKKLKFELSHFFNV